MDLGPPQTRMHVDDGRHVWLRWLRHIVMPNLVTPVTPNTVTPHGYANLVMPVTPNTVTPHGYVEFGYAIKGVVY